MERKNIRTQTINGAAALAGLKVRQILVPTDFSAASRRALRYARPLARKLRAKLVLLHVVPPHIYQADYGYGPVLRQTTDPGEMATATRHLQSIGKLLHATRLVRCGDAPHEIVRAARNLKSDLIVMGENATASLDAAKRDTTAEKTLRRAPCAVLVVRETGAELLKPRREEVV
jgi:universal stress protein A